MNRVQNCLRLLSKTRILICKMNVYVSVLHILQLNLLFSVYHVIALVPKRRNNPLKTTRSPTTEPYYLMNDTYYMNNTYYMNDTYYMNYTLCELLYINSNFTNMSTYHNCSMFPNFQYQGEQKDGDTLVLLAILSIFVLIFMIPLVIINCLRQHFCPTWLSSGSKIFK